MSSDEIRILAQNAAALLTVIVFLLLVSIPRRVYQEFRSIKSEPESAQYYKVIHCDDFVWKYMEK